MSRSVDWIKETSFCWIPVSFKYNVNCITTDAGYPPIKQKSAQYQCQLLVNQ